MWLREKRPPLDETTDQLAGTYPFVAGSGLPYFGQYHGVNRLSGSAWGWDGQVAYKQRIVSNPAMVIYGVIGSGKSMGAKSILWRGMPFGRKWAVPGDIRGEYTRLCRAAGGEPIVLGPGSPMRFSPLATPARPDDIHEGFWRETIANHRATTLSSLAKAALQRELTPVGEDGARPGAALGRARRRRLVALAAADARRHLHLAARPAARGARPRADPERRHGSSTRRTTSR